MSAAPCAEIAEKEEEEERAAKGKELWRPQLVDGMSLAMCILVAIGMPVVVLELKSLAIGIAASVLWVFLFSSWLTRKRTPLWFRTSALVLTGYFVMVSGYLVAGALVGPTLGAMMAVIVALLVFGRRAGLIMHGIVVVTMLLIAAGIYLGWVTPPPPDGASMTPATAWVREGLGFGIFGGVVLVAIAHVFKRVEDTLEETAGVLRRLREEQASKEAAQEALAESDRTVQELQRLEALGRLAGGVAHDFNNSLTVLMGGTHVLAASELSEDQEEVLADMQEAIDGATQLTRQLLMFGRRDVVAPRSVEIDSFLQGVLRSLTRVLPDDIQLESDLKKGPPVFIDPSQLHHAMVNLALNARDAMPDGGVLTVSSTTVDEDDQAKVLIRVRDTGYGMSASVREQALEPFFTTKGHGKGTGLGLPMVVGVVQRWGGQLRVVSPVQGEGGTLVEFTIPVGEVRETAIVAPVGTATQCEAVILLAEDEPLVRGTMQKLLVASGHTVVEAADGDEALAVLDSYQGTFDLLCVDGVMPGASCKSIINRFREDYPDKPVLVCSGYLAEELVRREIYTGELHYLAKPFTRDELVAKLEGLLRTDSA